MTPALQSAYPRGDSRRLVIREAGPAPEPRLLDRVRAAIRTRHYSRRTEEAYVAWIRRYILFHKECQRLGNRHVGAMLCDRLAGLADFGL